VHVGGESLLSVLLKCYIYMVVSGEEVQVLPAFDRMCDYMSSGAYCELTFPASTPAGCAAAAAGMLVSPMTALS
jgi:hypothetical protein